MDPLQAAVSVRTKTRRLGNRKLIERTTGDHGTKYTCRRSCRRYIARNVDAFVSFRGPEDSSGENTAELTGKLCPRHPTSLPLSVSHKRTVLSSLAVRIILPSGEKTDDARPA